MKTKFLIVCATVLVLCQQVPAQAVNEQKLNAQNTGEQSSEKPWIAVVEFSVPKEIQDKGINGWTVAKGIEHALFQRNCFRLANRSDISKVIKELKFQSSESEDREKARQMGSMTGADLLVTGDISLSEAGYTITAKLIDAVKNAGEVKRSVKASSTDISGLDQLYSHIAFYFSMSPDELINYGKEKLKEKNYEEALSAFKQAKIESPAALLKEIIEDTEKHAINQKTVRDREILYKNHITQGHRLLKSEDYVAAELEFKKILELPGFENDIAAKTGIEASKSGMERKTKQSTAKMQIERSLAEASALFDKARTAENAPATKAEARALCDRAIDRMENILKDTRSVLSKEELDIINDFIQKVEKYRDSLWGGPSPGKDWVIPDISMRFVYVKPGTFMMGEGLNPSDADPEFPSPPHSVTINREFWIGKYEVTIREYQEYLRDSKDPNKDREVDWTDPDCPLDKSYSIKESASPSQPMTEISWKGAEKFCAWLTDRERKARRLPEGYIYRLPTEAEWEYACRAGTHSAFSFGDNEALIIEKAVCKLNSGGRTQPVENSGGNPWGIFGMHGNVWEWCLDWYGPYQSGTVSDPRGARSSDENLKVARGGSFTSAASYVKSAYRTSYELGTRESYADRKNKILFTLIISKFRLTVKQKHVIIPSAGEGEKNEEGTSIYTD